MTAETLLATLGPAPARELLPDLIMFAEAHGWEVELHLGFPEFSAATVHRKLVVAGPNETEQVILLAELLAVVLP